MKNTFIGLILIVVGGLILLGNLGFISGDLTLFVIGGAFLFFYGVSGKSRTERKIGLLIPGMIVLAVGTFAFMDDHFNVAPYWFFVSLGLAFLGIYLIHTRYGQGGKWPLYPALGLFGFSVFVLLTTRFNLNRMDDLMSNLLPAAAIISGLVLLLKGRSSKGE